MYLQKIKEIILSSGYIKEIPEAEFIITRAADSPNAPWNYTFLACKSVGGKPGKALHFAAAQLCLLISIHLIDDMLDNDPKGYYHKVGTGKAANISSLFQAAGLLLVKKAGTPDSIKLAILDSYNSMLAETCIAQNSDNSKIIRSEQDYWDVVLRKTPPLFCSALFSGAMAGAQDILISKAIARLGILIGKIIQVGDDLNDVFAETTSPDWHTKTNSLPILYALLGDYSEKKEFIALLKIIKKPGILYKAQDILISSGAYSYCLYHMLELDKQFKNEIKNLDIPFPQHLKKIAKDLIRPAKNVMSLVSDEL